MSVKRDHILAYSTVGDGRAPIQITPKDRTRHIFAIGQTGTGKSTFLRTLIHQHLETSERGGFSFFDPHGEDAEELLNFVPADRLKEVIYFNPQDTEFPMGINLLKGEPSDEEQDRIVPAVIESLKQSWPDSWGPRMEHILRNTLYLLLSDNASTIADVNRLLVDDKFRTRLLEKNPGGPVKFFWQNEFAGYDHRFKIQAIAPIQNKIGYITSNSLLRNILCQYRQQFDFSDIFDKQKIFIANLSGIGTKESDFLGSLLLTSIQIAGMRRRTQAQPGAELTPHYIYIDEVHRFSTGTLSSMLSEIRKANISLTLAQQYLGQNTNEQVRKALLGNVATMAVFRVSPEDAKVLQNTLDPEIVKAPELSLLGLGELYLKTPIQGIPTTKRAKVNPKILIPRVGKAESAKKNSQVQFAGQKEKIMERILRSFR